MKSAEEKRISAYLARLFEEPAFEFVSDFKKTFKAGNMYFVGGGVRDVLLEREVKDYDFVVSGVDTALFEQFLKKHGNATFAGKKFGVFKFVPRDSNMIIDIAFPRTEEATGPGYHEFIIKSDPAVSIEEDLRRRDFTINALAFDVFKNTLLDQFGGVEDLGKKIIRTVGDPKKRFSEDYTRLLRAIRQACQLGFDLDEKTFEALKKEVPHIISKNKEPVVPFEMISQEFFKSVDAAPERTVTLLDESGLLEVLFPELERCKGVSQPLDVHPENDLFLHILIVLHKLKKEDSLRLKLGALFHDIGKPDTAKKRIVKGEKRITFYNHPNVGAELFEKCAKRMKFPSKLVRGVSFLIYYHLFLWQGDIRAMRPTTIAKVFLDDLLLGKDLITLHSIDISDEDLDRSKKLSYLEDARAYITEMKEKLMTAEQERITLPINGSDIIGELGVAEGPEIGTLLAKAKDYYIEKKLEGKEVTKETLMSFLKNDIQ
ncbi:CCA tRNA nucleotidyltransferase [Patescibacteria group bacterium]|nr:CCA tRNA nucleotidyltransferase [Patescibacteria group bacterium]